MPCSHSRARLLRLAVFLPGALVCSLTRLDVAGSMLDPDLARVRARLTRELAAVAAAEGHPIWPMPVWLTQTSGADAGGQAATLGSSEDEIVAEYAVQGARMRAQGVPLYPSMTTDIANGRPSELEDTAGDMVHRANRQGMPLPVLTLCYWLLRGVERSTASASP